MPLDRMAQRCSSVRLSRLLHHRLRGTGGARSSGVAAVQVDPRAEQVNRHVLPTVRCMGSRCLLA